MAYRSRNSRGSYRSRAYRGRVRSSTGRSGRATKRGGYSSSRRYGTSRARDVRLVIEQVAAQPAVTAADLASGGLMTTRKAQKSMF